MNARTIFFALSLIIVLLMLSADSYAQIPVARYMFNGNAQDATGNGHDGIVHDAQPTYDRFGNANSAYLFDSLSYIEIPHSEALAFGTKDFSISAWVKFCSPHTQYAGIVCKGPTNIQYPGYQLVIMDENKIGTQIGTRTRTNNLDFVETNGRTPLNDNQWHFLCLVVSPMNQTVSLYVDGELERSEKTPVLDASRNSTNPLFIGKERNSVIYFEGVIDDVTLVSGTLSDSTIVDMYFEGGWEGPGSGIFPPITADGSTRFCKNEELLLQAPDGFSNYTWSDGKTGQSRYVWETGTYWVSYLDKNGCKGKSAIYVRAEDCGDSNLLFTYYLPEKCPGHTEMAYIPFYNPSYGENAVSIMVHGTHASQFQPLTTPPLYLEGHTYTNIPVQHRWLHPGRQHAILKIEMESGKEYRIGLRSTVSDWSPPVLSVDELALPYFRAPYDTCIFVTNRTGSIVTFIDTAWDAHHDHIELVSPVLPMVMLPDQSAEFCFRFSDYESNWRSTLVVAGVGKDADEMFHCYSHPFVLHTPLENGVSGIAVTDDRKSDLNLRISPNPVRSTANVSISLQHSANVLMTLLTPDGNETELLYNNRLSAGNQVLLCDFTQYPTGRYFLILRTNDRTTISPLTILR